jgi:peptidoglycan-N-acetylmuramic acid deacetylase
MIITRNKRSVGTFSLVVCFALLAACTDAAEKPSAAPAEQTPPPAAEAKAKAPQLPEPEQTSLHNTSPVEPAPEPKPSSVAWPAQQVNDKQASSATVTAKTYKSANANDRKAYSWYYMKQPKGKVPNFPGETSQFASTMKALWVGTGKKVYLTIDTGGPLGDTELLVKSLRDNHAKANFFIAGYNVKKDPEFVRTLVKDGHLVANHTMTHTDMNLQTDEQVKKEILDYEKLYTEVTGQEIQPYFRFPYGRYNMHLLSMVSDMGYASVFWSTAMKDWEPRKNGAEDPYNDITNNLHDGNIILMHQGSPENIEALDRIIKGIRNAGYELALLTDIQPPPK